MKTNNDNQSFLYRLNGRRLVSFGCEADILEFVFEGNFVLHAMGFSRVINGNDILVTTHDYQSWDELDSTHNDEWVNAAAFREHIVGGIVLSVLINEVHDLKIMLDNGILIECIVANSYPHYSDEKEQWLLFEHTNDHSGKFLTAYNKKIELT